MKRITLRLIVLCGLVITIAVAVCRRMNNRETVHLQHTENTESCTYTAVFPVRKSTSVSACLNRELAGSSTVFKNKIRLKDGTICSIRPEPGKLFISVMKSENSSTALAHIHRLYDAIPQALR